MDKFITEFLVKEIRIGKMLLAPIDLLVLIGMTVAGIMLRTSVFGYTFVNEESALYGSYMEVAAGMKFTGCVFDMALALLAAAIVYQLTGHKIKSFLAYGITAVLPVLVAESVMWGTADSVYLFFAMLSMHFLLKDKTDAAVLVYGISVFLNGFALFLLPLYLVLFLNGKTHLYSFSLPLLGGVLRSILMGTEGGSAFPLFTVEHLLAVSREEELLSYNCPNIFGIIGADKFTSEYKWVALFFVIGLIMMYCMVLITRELSWTKEQLLEISLFFCLFIPFVAPGMNERSFLLADMLALVLGFMNLKKFYLPVIMVTVTYISYSAYFRGESALPVAAVSFAVLILIAHLVKEQVAKGWIVKNTENLEEV